MFTGPKSITGLGRPGALRGPLAPSKGGGVPNPIVTNTIMRDSFVMRDSIRMTDRD